METELIDHGGDDATLAFNEVRDRLAGLTRAVDSMAGEWKALAIPDYQPTLEKMADTLAANGETLDALSEMPALRMGPQELGAAIIKAGKDARAEDHNAIAAATTTLESEARALRGALTVARSAADQRKLVHRIAVGAFLAGALFWAILGGFAARVMPESWQLPERMAARTLRLDRWEAGQRLMETANFDAWNRIRLAATIQADNRQAIERCAATAARRRAEVPCTIVIKP
jgi:Family of unknown function (DUF6118)